MAKRVLIADDALFMRMKLKRIVEGLGHQVVGEAANGRDAVEQFLSIRPDLVLMDITMPDMDGIAALKTIRTSDSTASVVMVTAMGQEVYVMDAIRAGAKDYVIKPFEEERVKAVLQRLVG
ncbi:response regulator [Heliobacterium chlorum]|uniref:Stage 0 sporulation protein A homolog n=1 Tax=Heliobacterium chlorum TaxID=2698 RepID=A0ABR7T3F4_HELCL|nr:response regulator [Heliobacterium chlorum]MBC9785308.1 response regulator [Heliobacterium chlorum]